MKKHIHPFIFLCNRIASIFWSPSFPTSMGRIGGAKGVFLLLFPFSVLAQNEIKVQIIIPPPYSPRISDYFSYEGRGILTLTNTTDKPYQVRLGVRFESRESGVVITNDGTIPNEPLILNGKETKTINATTGYFEQYFTLYGIEKPNLGVYSNKGVTALAQELLLSNALPEGDYKLCVTAYDYQSGKPLSSPSPMQQMGCANLYIKYLLPPVLTTPFCNSTLTTPANLFRWQPPFISADKAGLIEYNLYIVKLEGAESPQDALFNAIRNGSGNLWKYEEIQQPFFSLLAENPLGLEAGQYAWAVIAKSAEMDNDKSLFFENGGMSNVCTFSIKSNAMNLDPTEITEAETKKNQENNLKQLSNADFAWDYYFGGDQSEIVYKVIQNFTGGFVGVGETTSNVEGGKDVYLVLLDKKGNLLYERPIGGKGDDAAFSVIQTYDGGYVITGYTESNASKPRTGMVVPNRDKFKNQSGLCAFEVDTQEKISTLLEEKPASGKRDALLIKTDEKGKTIWMSTFGSDGNDEFRDIVQTIEGDFVVTGVKDGKLWYAKIDKRGKKILWEQTYKNADISEGNAIAFTKDKYVLITGFAAKNKDDVGSLLFIKASLDGKKIFEQQFSQNGFAQGMYVFELRNGNYAIGGIAKTSDKKEQAAVLVTNKEGDTQFSKSYGDGKWTGGVNTLIETPDSNLLLAGYTSTQGRFYQQTDSLMLKVNLKDGTPLWVGRNEATKPNPSNVQKDGKIQSAILANDGSVVCAGFSTRPSKSDDAWFFKAFERKKQPAIEAKSIQTSQPRFADDDASGKLNPEERGAITFEVSNIGKTDAAAMQSTIVVRDSIKGTTYYPTVQLPYLKAGETQTIAVPIKGMERMNVGAVSYDIRLSDANNNVVKNIDYVVETDKIEPQITVVNAKFDANGAIPAKGKPITFTVELKNTGNAKAEKINCIFGFPYKVEKNTPNIVPVGTLEPGTSQVLKFTFTPETVFLDQAVRIHYRVSESADKYGINGEYAVELGKPIKEIVPKAAEAKPNTLRLWWSSAQTITTEQPTYQFSIDLESDKTIEEEDVKVFNKGQQIGYLQEAQLLQNQYPGIKNKTYRYTATIYLVEGENSIEVEAKNAIGTQRSKPLPIVYTRNKARGNLYVLSIGVPLREDKLQYTQKDAEDFANLFKGQEGKYFEKINIEQSTTFENTHRQAVMTSFKGLKQRFLDGEIKPEDAVIVFISSQAVSHADKSFKIKTRDYDGFYEDLTSIEYVSLAKRYLEPIQCHKLLLIDAFHYKEVAINKAKGEKVISPSLQLSSALAPLIAQQKTLNTIMACSSGEASYENIDWQNGAFAKAIKTCIGNPTSTTPKHLKVSDLYAFIQEDVQKTTSGKQLKQTPFFQSVTEDFEVYGF